MGKAVSAMCQFVPGLAAAETIEARTIAPGPAVQMLESVGGPGRVPAGPLPLLVISQAIGGSFRYHCDLGAGPFSGQGAPLDFVVAVPDAPAWCQIDQQHRLRFLGIPLPLARSCLGLAPDAPVHLGRVHTRHHHDPFIAQTLDTLWEELRVGDQTSRLFLETALASLLARLQRLSAETLVVAEAGALTAWQSGRVLDYMRAHLASPVTLGELAALAGLSPWHFARAFRTTHGLPPHRFLTGLRLEKARELLTHSQLPVTEIAAATGFSPQHLARTFRRQFGCSPSQYRRQPGH